MNRRNFLKVAGLAASSSIAPVLPSALASAKRYELRFYVAGVRFHRLKKTPHAGDPLTIRERKFRDQTCYAVLTSNGEQVGWVPKSVALGNDFHACTACMSKVDQHALPWKRYQVGI